MAKLIYSAITSLDGYIEDEHGKFDWAQPDEEVHSFVNELERPVGTYLLGRRMYEVMLHWENVALAGQPAYINDFADGLVDEYRVLPHRSWWEGASDGSQTMFA